MKKNGVHLFRLTLVLLFAASCNSENDNTDAETWKLANEEAFNEIARNPDYTEIKSPGHTGSIYRKALAKGEGTQPIYYTSTVNIYYKGWFVATDEANGITKGQIAAQRLFDDGAPLSVAVSNAYLREGLQIALQHMVKGDKWEVWMPYRLAGKTTSSDIPAFSTPAYSTLAFEIEVVEVNQ